MKGADEITTDTSEEKHELDRKEVINIMASEQFKENEIDMKKMLQGRFAFERRRNIGIQMQ